MKKIAIVAPELVGLYKNGGIGTNYFFRARFLSSCLNHQVTVLYTGSCCQEAVIMWREQYVHTGIRLEVLPKLLEDTNLELFQRRAMAVHQWLVAETWDEIHLPEYLANGFVCLQAKQAGLAYQNTRLVVSMHSSSLWLREGMQQWSLDPVKDTRLDYAEQYCCEHADTLVSPSRFLMDWAERRGWRLPPNRVVLPHLYEQLGNEHLPPAQNNPRHLVFFGRLQTLKGLGVFCEAVERLAAAGKAPERVDFLGELRVHGGLPADQYIRQMSSRWPETKTQIHADLDNFSAMQHIRRTGGLVVIASLLDNLPYTVIECIINQVPFVASNSGGIPELADVRVLFTPDARSLAAKLEEFFKLPPDAKFDHPYQIENARQAWKKFMETPTAMAAPSAVLPPLPKISVCVPFYNHGRYLSDALASLACQSYDNFEVIIVDDGSTDAAAVECFARMQTQYRQFRFFKQANSGVGVARNLAVAHAAGDWLVFMDADNIATERMLAVFARAMQFSGADCATCHYAFFFDEAELHDPPVRTCAPLGPCLEAGWRSNVFGDANFIVKKNVFAALGGFAADRSAVEDWQFLVRLTLRGFRQIVIPEKLYWYRHLPDSMMRTANKIQFTRIILETYREGMSSWPARIIENHAFGPFWNDIFGKSNAINNSAKPVVPKARQRGKFISKLRKSCVKRLLELAGFISRL